MRMMMPFERAFLGKRNQNIIRKQDRHRVKQSLSGQASVYAREISFPFCKVQLLRVLLQTHSSGDASGGLTAPAETQWQPSAKAGSGNRGRPLARERSLLVPGYL